MKGNKRWLIVALAALLGGAAEAVAPGGVEAQFVALLRVLVGGQPPASLPEGLPPSN